MKTKLFLIFTIIFFTISCSGLKYKRFSDNSKIFFKHKANTALLINFSITTKADGPFSTFFGIASARTTRSAVETLLLVEENINNSIYRTLNYEARKNSMPYFVFTKDDVFNYAALKGNTKLQKFRTLRRKGYTHVFVVNLFCAYLHYTLGRADIAHIKIKTSLRSLKYTKYYYWFYQTKYYKVILEKINGTNYTLNEISYTGSDSKKILSKVLNASIKKLIKAAFLHLNTGRTTKFKEEYNAERYIQIF